MEYPRHSSGLRLTPILQLGTFKGPVQKGRIPLVGWDAMCVSVAGGI